MSSFIELSFYLKNFKKNISFRFSYENVQILTSSVVYCMLGVGVRCVWRPGDLPSDFIIASISQLSTVVAGAVLLSTMHNTRSRDS